MKNFFLVLWTALLLGSGAVYGQCDIDTTNQNIGFSPATPAVIQPGIAYSQTVQVYVPATYSPYTVDSLHIDSITGMPNGITYVLNPVTGTVIGGSNGAICFTGTTNDTVGPYPLTFYGLMYLNGGPVPFSYLVQVDPTFGYKFRVETVPGALFSVDSPVCTSADTVKFVDHTTGYPTRWTWKFTGGSPATSTLQFPLVVYDSAGTYTVMLIARNGIAADTLTQSITVNPSVTGSVSTTPASGALSATGTAVVYVSGGTYPLAYSWSNGAATDSVSGLLPGAYQVSVTDGKGCKYTNDTVNVSFINGIIQLSTDMQVRIYPNPASDILNIAWAQKANAEVAITDLNGNEVASFVANTTNNQYDIHNLAAGAYIIRITDKSNGQQKSLPFTKL